MVSSWETRLSESLQKRSVDGVLRERRALDSACQPRVVFEGRDCLNFCSNDYLGLANHPDIKKAAIDAISEFGVGAGASHLVCGHHRLHQQLEQALADFTGRDAALLFPSGFQANCAIQQVLLTKNDCVFQDKLNHASLIDGARASAAKLVRYRHLDMSHLERLLDREGYDQSGQRMLISDSVFSMDGDIAPVAELVALAEQHQAILMLDDAHGFGVLGARGAGIVEHAALDQKQLPILMATLGKSAGVYGAFVAGSRVLIDSLVNHARNYIYTTAVPPQLAAATLASLRLISQPERRVHLINLVRRFKNGLQAMGIVPATHDTPIQKLVFGDNDNALAISRALFERGILVSAIRPPTVPENTARLRVTLSAAHSESDVDQLLQELEVALKRLDAVRTVSC